MAYTFVFLFSFLLVMLSHLSNLGNGYESPDIGFSVDLFHRDSPHSPFSNPSDTYSDRLRKAIHRSNSRFNRFHKHSPKSTSFQSIVSPDANAGYLAKILIGTPPVEALVVVDTGSPLTWLQCKPCISCFKQIGPIFDPKKSSSHKPLPCKSKTCQKLLGNPNCSAVPKSICPYELVYADNSHSLGEVVTDSFTFDSTNGRRISLPKLAHGCGYNNSGSFGNSTGVMGLSISPMNLISQLGLTKFSYCLTSITSDATGKLKVGSHAAISGKGKVSTPFISTPDDTFYYMSLEGISVGNKRFPMTLNASTGNIVIDSGTLVPRLPSNICNKLVAELKKSIKAKPIKAPDGSFDYCYRTKFNVEVPVMTFHFTGADLKLSKANTFLQVSDDVECFMISPDDENIVFGSIMQKDLQVEYDLAKKTISFAPVDCTRF